MFTTTVRIVHATLAPLVAIAEGPRRDRHQPYKAAFSMLTERVFQHRSRLVRQRQLRLRGCWSQTDKIRRVGDTAR